MTLMMGLGNGKKVFCFVYENLENSLTALKLTVEIVERTLDARHYWDEHLDNDYWNSDIKGL